MSVQVKSFLSTEGKRNRANADLYLGLLQTAYPGEVLDVIVGHHICFEFDKDIATENEIPAADTLLFDREIMGKVFGGDKARDIMLALVDLDAEKREDYVREEFNALKSNHDDSIKYSWLTSLEV